MEAKIFKKYDIRAVYPDQMNAIDIRRIAQAYVEFMRSQYPNTDLQLVVAYDMRTSGDILHEAVIDGITAMGVDVIDIGKVSSPTFYYAVARYGYDGGLQVTASHNPKEYNGIKMVKRSAVPISGDTGIYEIRDLALSDKEIAESDTSGSVTYRDDVLQSCVEHALGFYDFSIKPLKVVVDPAHAMGSLDMDALFALLPCELVRMNWELDGTFPAHPADPLDDKNNEQLKAKVKACNADLGIAIDGDGDRIFFVDNAGQTIEQPIIRGLLSQAALRQSPGSKILYDIRPGMITHDMILESGGIPEVSKVGHSLIKEHGMREGVPFAGESSGHFFFRTEYGFFETTLIVALVIMDLISRSDVSIKELVDPYRIYANSGEHNSRVADVDAKLEEVKAAFSDANEINDLDGYMFYYDDYWFIVRASNTEPLLRLIVEARSEEIMNEKLQEILAIIRS